MEYSNSYWCDCSGSISEHWLCVEFRGKQILPLNYLIRGLIFDFLKGGKSKDQKMEIVGN
jgi:hypothetical protein